MKPLKSSLRDFILIVIKGVLSTRGESLLGSLTDDIHLSRVLSSNILDGALDSIIGHDTRDATSKDRQCFLPVKAQHSCKRTCVEGEAMTCEYHFKIEHYYAMSKACYNCPATISDCYRKDCVGLDGYDKVLYTVNRQLPGPTVEICEGDNVLVTIENKMTDETTSIHWHGILMEGTPYMDGVPFLTQCPVNPGETFLVNFTAVDWGTHYWHGHTGVQRADGLFGAIIVKQPLSKTIHAELYDEDDDLLVMHDWSHTSAAGKLLSYLHKGGNDSGDTILVNGAGRYYYNSKQLSNNPIHHIVVEQGKRYRIRLLHAGIYDCPIEVYIDQHVMVIIASDGNEIDPIIVDSLVMYAGERFDLVLHANQAVGNYWMRLTGLMNCKRSKVHTVVPVNYKGADCKDPTSPVGYNVHAPPKLILNGVNVAKNQSGNVNIPTLKSHKDNANHNEKALQADPDVLIVLPYDFNPLNNPTMHLKGFYGFYEVNSSRQVNTPQVNRVSLVLPSVPLLSQPCNVDPDCFCGKLNNTNCTEEFCQCTVVHKVPLGAVVEIILIDLGNTFDANHPFHLHGYAFRVVAMDKLGSSTSNHQVFDLDKAGLLVRNLENRPPFKDTVTVPDGGYTILRMVADNPGYWLFHCHIEIHYELKMGVIIKVGDESDFPPVPDNFPKCGLTSSYEETTCSLPHKYFTPTAVATDDGQLTTTFEQN